MPINQLTRLDPEAQLPDINEYAVSASPGVELHLRCNTMVRNEIVGEHRKWYPLNCGQHLPAVFNGNMCDLTNWIGW